MNTSQRCRDAQEGEQDSDWYILCQKQSVVQ